VAPRTAADHSQQAVLERFLAALRTGRLRELMDLMAPNVVLIAHGGGLASAATAPIRGVELVASALAREADDGRARDADRVAQRSRLRAGSRSTASRPR
jgi:hypothetical protein